MLHPCVCGKLYPRQWAQGTPFWTGVLAWHLRNAQHMEAGWIYTPSSANASQNSEMMRCIGERQTFRTRLQLGAGASLLHQRSVWRFWTFWCFISGAWGMFTGPWDTLLYWKVLVSIRMRGMWGKELSWHAAEDWNILMAAPLTHVSWGTNEDVFHPAKDNVGGVRVAKPISSWCSFGWGVCFASRVLAFELSYIDSMFLLAPKDATFYLDWLHLVGVAIYQCPFEKEWLSTSP